MRKQLIVACAVCLGAFLGVMFTWKTSPPREPVYQGKALSTWVAQYNRGGVEWLTADAAVRQAGTNSIPILLRMLCERDSNLKTWLMGMAQKQRWIKVQLVPAWVRNQQGASGFRALGADGKAAVPALIEIYNQNLSRASRNATADALAWIGPPAKKAVPSLLRQMTNADYSVRSMAVKALGRIHAHPEVVVPVLAQALQDSEPHIRQIAAHSLGQFAGEARLAIPALLRLQESGDSVQQQIARTALEKITVSSLCDW